MENPAWCRNKDCESLNKNLATGMCCGKMFIEMRKRYRICLSKKKDSDPVNFDIEFLDVYWFQLLLDAIRVDSGRPPLMKT